MDVGNYPKKFFISLLSFCCIPFFYSVVTLIITIRSPKIGKQYWIRTFIRIFLCLYFAMYITYYFMAMFKKNGVYVSIIAIVLEMSLVCSLWLISYSFQLFYSLIYKKETFFTKYGKIVFSLFSIAEAVCSILSIFLLLYSDKDILCSILRSVCVCVCIIDIFSTVTIHAFNLLSEIKKKDTYGMLNCIVKSGYFLYVFSLLYQAVFMIINFIFISKVVKKEENSSIEYCNVFMDSIFVWSLCFSQDHTDMLNYKTKIETEALSMSIL